MLFGSQKVLQFQKDNRDCSLQALLPPALVQYLSTELCRGLLATKALGIYLPGWLCFTKGYGAFIPSSSYSGEV